VIRSAIVRSGVSGSAKKRAEEVPMREGKRSLIGPWMVLVAAAGCGLLVAACGGSSTPPPAASEQAAAPAPSAPSEEASHAGHEETSAAPEVAAAPSGPAPAKPKPAARPAPVAESAHEAAPAEPAPQPRPEILTVAAGTGLAVEFLDGVSSRSSEPGDSFRARVTEDVTVDGVVVIPAGSLVKGQVTEAVSLKKVGGTARLALEFNRLELPSGEVVPIVAGFAKAGKSETAKDAATIAGATAGGALLGRVLSKKEKGKGTVLGAIVGGAAGTAIAAKTKGEEVDIPAGTVLDIALSEPAKVTVYR